MSIQRTLLVASTGGHLEQLSRLRRRFDPDLGEVRWATFDSPQSRSLLAGEHVEFVRPVPTRGLREAAISLPEARRWLRREGITQVISTGSGIAVPWLTAARSLGLEAHYVESTARGDGPSLTGRILSKVPGVHLYAQAESWADERWAYRGSLFDNYAATVPASTDVPIRRVVVTLGTLDYGFRRAVEALVPTLAEVATPDAEVLWQVGLTDTSGLGIEGRERVPAHELRSAIEEADLVIAHAGVGSCLVALDAGRCPVLLSRRAAHGEHVDDHQTMLSRELSSRLLAVAAEPETLSGAHLREAARRGVERNEHSTPFGLAQKVEAAQRTRRARIGTGRLAG
ncbi:glycosyltransferase [Actinomycetota bacterium]